MKKVILSITLITVVLSLSLIKIYNDSSSKIESNTNTITTISVDESTSETIAHQHKYEVIQSSNPTCTENGVTTYECSCGETKTEESPSLEHNYNSIVTKPTCTEQGYTTHTCLRCNDSYKDNCVDPLGHTEIAVPAVSATCTSTGLTEGKKCSVCDAIIVAQTKTKVIGHNYNSVVTAPTCTKKGYTTHTCSKCKNSYIDSYVNASGHSWSDWETTKAPSVKENGNQERKCESCSLVESKVIDKLPKPVEYINLDNYQTTISYNGLTADEVEIVKNLLVEYEKYKRGEVEEIRYNSNIPLSHKNYYKIASFFVGYFYNSTDIGNIVSIYAADSPFSASVVLEKDIVDKYIKEKTEIDELVENVLPQMVEGTEEYKLRQISDWLKNNFQYKSGVADAYSAIKSGNANCNSFALLFKAMASRLGIQCDMCIGYSTAGKHAWNMVTLSNGDVRFYDVSAYDVGWHAPKCLNLTESPYNDYALNDYSYQRD